MGRMLVVAAWLTGVASGLILAVYAPRSWTCETGIVDNIAVSAQTGKILLERVEPGGGRGVELWDSRGVQPEQRFQVAERNTYESMFSIALSPDGKTILTGSEDGTVRFWDVETGRALHVLTAHTSWVTKVAFSPDGKTALSGSADGTAKIWDVQNGTLLHTLDGHADRVVSIA